jgi:hypothetical protein
MSKSHDTWHVRDLPFLAELVDQLDACPQTWITGDDVARALSLGESDAHRALANLKRGGHVLSRPGVPLRNGDGPLEEPLEVTDLALYAVGVWPTEQTALDRMITALEAIADNTDEDQDTRTRARKILDNLTGAGRQIGISVAAAAITGQIPGTGG